MLVPDETEMNGVVTQDAITAGGDGWDQRLGFLMHDVSRLRRTAFDQFMQPLGVTRSQWWVLAYLSRQEGMSQSELASVLELGKAALGGLIDRLEGAGLVRRESDEGDRRIKRVYITPKGEALVRQMLERSHEMSELILAGLSSHERGALAELLSRVKRNLLQIKLVRTAEGEDAGG